MRKLKHSKFKNTGVIFEILTRKLVVEVLNKKQPSALGIIRKYFRGTELAKELKLYHALQEIRGTGAPADKLIDLVLESYRTIDAAKLSKEKYRLVGEIKNELGGDKFFESRITNYKLLASIYKLLEYSASENPSEHINCRTVVCEHITGDSQADNILKEVGTTWKSEHPDIKRLAYRIIVEKFNEKYKDLNPDQKRLLKLFVNEDSSTDTFRDFVYKEVGRVRAKLTTIAENIDDDVMRIKLSESIDLMELVASSNTIKNEHLSAMMKYYELVEELS